jgi:hypothetical protein
LTRSRGLAGAVEKAWVPLIGVVYSKRLVPIKRTMLYCLFASPLFFAIALVVGRAVASVSVWLVIAIFTLPFVGVTVGFALQLRLGSLISSDLRAAGHPVREACFVRSPADLAAWSTRNGIASETIAAVGDGNQGNPPAHMAPEGGPLATPTHSIQSGGRGLPSWSELMGADYALRFSSIRLLSIFAAPSPFLVVIALVCAAISGGNVGEAACAGAIASVVLICVAVARLQMFGKGLAVDLDRAGYRINRPPLIRNKGSFILWQNENQLTAEIMARVGRGSASIKK